MKQLKISKEISLPPDVVTQTIAILAKRRAGKSYTMRKLVEQLLNAQEQVILVDPKGDQWGIRSSADGKKPGFPILILGGEHGDAPLEVNSGEVVAKLVVEERVSVLIDLSTFRKYEIAVFMSTFLENLYRLKAQEKYRTPVMLIIDEADAIAPQKPQKGEERMLGAAEDIVRRGGQRGIGCALITQRSAVLNKNVLTQAQMLIVLRTIAPQDLAAMKAWIDVHGSVEQGKELMDSLPALPIGDAWFWSPGWPTAEGIFARSHILPIETFDSAATPKPGEKKVTPNNLADVDMDALKKQMAETIEKAKNEDPKLLKKKIMELEHKLVTIQEKKVTNSSNTKIVQERVEVPIFKDSQITRLEKISEQMTKEAERHGNAMSLLWGNFNEIGDALQKAFEVIRLSKNTPLPEIKNPGMVSSLKIIKELPKHPQTIGKIYEVQDGNKTLSKCARSILSYLHGAYPSEKKKSQLWIATGYVPGGGFSNSMSELTTLGLIERTQNGYISTERHTPDLIDESFEPSFQKWYPKLSLCANRIFQVLLQDPTTPVKKTDLIEKTGYAAGGGFSNALSELSKPDLIKRWEGGYIINPDILKL